MEDVNIQDSALELVNPFGRPIPGQSMTNDPDNPQPFEGPAEYSNHSEAIAWIVNQLFTEEMVLNVVDVLSNGLPVSELAYMILYEGFREGKWNPDLMMLLAEPVMYLLLYIAERADIEDVVIYTDEENEEFEELDGTEKIKSISLAQNSINEQAKLKEMDAASSINLESILPEGLAQEVEERVPSLLERP
jgi:hypothetical protein